MVLLGTVVLGALVLVLVVGLAGLRAPGTVEEVDEVDDEDDPVPIDVEVVELDEVDELEVEVVLVVVLRVWARVGTAAVSRADTARTAPAKAREENDKLGALPPGGLGRRTG